MRSLLPIAAFAILLSACSNPKPKGCPDWYEGANCQIQMRQKWVGTFAGVRYKNSNAAGTPDTFIFVTDSLRIDFDHCSNKNFDWSIRNTREAAMPIDPLAQLSTQPVYSGVGIVSEDGRYATLTYTLITAPNGTFDPHDTAFYTFTGTKQ